MQRETALFGSSGTALSFCFWVQFERIFMGFEIWILFLICFRGFPIVFFNILLWYCRQFTLRQLQWWKNISKLFLALILEGFVMLA